MMESTRSSIAFQRSPRILGLLLVLFVPFVQALLYGTRVFNWLPVWSWYADPGYPYLLNGAVIINGGIPGHTDHPGTSLQWLIGIIEQITFWVHGSSSTIFIDIVRDPEGYAQIISWVLLSLYIAALLGLGYRMWRVFGTSVALLTQLLLLWTVALLGNGVFKLVPETLVLLAFLALLILLMPNFKNPRHELNAWLIVAVGVSCAVGVTSKIIFLPALILPILVLRFRDTALAVIAFMVTLVLIMLPTFSRINQMWNWYLGVLLNPGRHGGTTTSSTLDSLTNALQGISGVIRWWLPVFFLVAGSSLLLFIVSSFRKRIGRESISVAALLTASALVIAMGYKQAEPRDFLLLGPLIAVLLGVLLSLYRRTMSESLGVGVTLTTLLLGAFLAAHGIVGSIYSYPLSVNRSMERVESAKIMNQIATDRFIASAYDSWTQASALAFAEDWTNGNFARPLTNRYPEIYEYSIWDQRIYGWNAGRGRELVTCSEVIELITSKGLDIVVPGIGTVTVNESLTSIESPDGTIFVSEEQKIGPNTRFKAIGMRCSK